MHLHLVQQANTRPFHCAVIPYLGNSNASGFIRTGSRLGDDDVYISFEAGKLIAKAMRWVDPRVVQALETQIAALQARLDQLEEEVKEADKLTEAARYSLERFGSKVQNKPGRKKKEPSTAKAA